jgi:hypothetical protein
LHLPKSPGRGRKGWAHDDASSAFVSRGSSGSEHSVSFDNNTLFAVSNENNDRHKSVEIFLVNSKTIDPLILYTTKELMALPLPVSPETLSYPYSMMVPIPLHESSHIL